MFQLRESDLAAFSAYAKKGILYAVVKDKNAGDGLVDLITNVDFASQVNLFLERHAMPRRSGRMMRQKSRCPRSTRELLTTAREWLAAREDDY